MRYTTIAVLVAATAATVPSLAAPVDIFSRAIEEASLAERDNEYAALFARVHNPPPSPPGSPGQPPQPPPEIPPHRIVQHPTPPRTPTPPHHARRRADYDMEELFRRMDLGWQFDELD
ncbi:hypothetical protein FOMPIDRAFT_1054212 [Fomitopsis schrenkii]|uniref:Uncharacterized protein n=1 Tax=Fomitopsis schrenkii TaxID=2126942 RepID=S8F0P9_FOMSC|nr:hypothetical protein FOMPIDRAFT_1054212 [Fomitopsis schrenkii]